VKWQSLIVLSSFRWGLWFFF